MPTPPHEHLITLDIDGHTVHVPAQIFMGALFQCLAAPQQQFVLSYIAQVMASQQAPAIVVPGNGTPLRH